MAKKTEYFQVQLTKAQCDTLFFLLHEEVTNVYRAKSVVRQCSQIPTKLLRTGYCDHERTPHEKL